MKHTYKVERWEFNDFTEDQQNDWCDSNNGGGREWASYLVVLVDGEIDQVYSDAMEPEDAKFYRDLDWIAGALKAAYDFGRKNGR